MSNLLISQSLAQESSTPAQGASSQEFSFASLMPLFLIFAIFYFLIIRPQSKKIKEHQNMVNNIKSGDKVITSGGIIGVVKSVQENELEIEIANNVQVKVFKSFISDLVREEKSSKKSK